MMRENRDNPTAGPSTVDWSSVDWSKRTRDLAAELDRHPSNVSMMRARYAPETIGRRGRTDWSSVDWSLTNRQLQEMYGVTKQCVASRRARHAPETLPRRNRNYRRPFPPFEEEDEDGLRIY